MGVASGLGDQCGWVLWWSVEVLVVVRWGLWGTVRSPGVRGGFGLQWGLSGGYGSCGSRWGQCKLWRSVWALGTRTGVAKVLSVVVSAGSGGRWDLLVSLGALAVVGTAVFSEVSRWSVGSLAVVGTEVFSGVLEVSGGPWQLFIVSCR